MNRGKAYWLLILLLALLSAYGLDLLRPSQMLVGIAAESAVLALVAAEMARRANPHEQDLPLLVGAMMVLLTLLCSAFLLVSGFIPVAPLDILATALLVVVSFAADRGSADRFSMVELLFLTSSAALSKGLFLSSPLLPYCALFLLMAAILYFRTGPKGSRRGFPGGLRIAIALTSAAVFAVAIYLYPGEIVQAAVAFFALGRLAA